ncbi:PTS system mannose/fructose/sorbose family transporter subunit IID [Aerococcus urinae]|uniref:PTS system mannose/fructose/sorbose family transporter subunit IID n=1 Tax=Aerococcus urinae TaxID=1376 RepID=UPI00254ED866|nr:PTS system mannose/fructose/sorbose family transporter subunit IID [Aerococcus urinae]MDK6371109.1 PTS system mannose/fructose/sorbose family transporter subunit IID [Aerococcus urinae]
MTNKIDKKILRKVFWNQMTIRCANNYERQQNAGFTQSMIPVIESLYNSDEDKKSAYSRHMEYFLTNDITSAIPIGISVAMEETNANNEEFDSSNINAIKTALMGPLAGLGDSLLNGTARPILASLGISLISAGLGWLGPIFFVIGMSFVSIGMRYLGVYKGYSEGIKLVELINQSGLIDSISDIAAIAAYMIVGGFLPALVVIHTPITIGSGDSALVLQNTLDGLVPGLLGLLYTLGMYCLIQKRKVNATVLILLTMLVGIVGTYLGVLG